LLKIDSNSLQNELFVVFHVIIALITFNTSIPFVGKGTQKLKTIFLSSKNKTGQLTRALKPFRQTNYKSICVV